MQGTGVSSEVLSEMDSSLSRQSDTLNQPLDFLETRYKQSQHFNQHPLAVPFKTVVGYWVNVMILGKGSLKLYMIVISMYRSAPQSRSSLVELWRIINACNLTILSIQQTLRKLLSNPQYVRDCVAR